MAETIFAEATAPGRAGLSVIRVSGPSAYDTLSTFGVPEIPARYATLHRLQHDGETIDEALVLRFEPGRSFTGEAVVELHLHGSRAIVAYVLQALSGLPGYRPAEAGEFARRALTNGRMDLTEIEGLADLLDAETEAQRRQAQRVFDGAFGALVERWRKDLLRVVAEVEARIDFADEEIDGILPAHVLTTIRSLQQSFEREAAGQAVAERVRSGFEVALVGAPNVGKSSLINKLSKREAALTSEIAGTTRDVIEVRFDLVGLPVTFLDLAGVRDTTDPVECLGVQRAIDRASSADLRVFMGSVPDAVVFREGDLRVSPKADVDPAEDGLPVSSVTGEGVDALLAHVSSQLSDRASGSGLAIRDRHRVVLLEGATALLAAEAVLAQPDPALEEASEHLRRGLFALDSVVGRIGVEDVLGEIFSAFCIGK